MPELTNIVATNVRRLRQEKGWNQEELADRTGVSSRYIGSIERARVAISITVLGRLADAFGAQPEDLIRKVSSRRS